MSALEPSVALTTCETALRQLMTLAYEAAYGDDWLGRIASKEQLDTWHARAGDELAVRGRKGVLAVPNGGLAHSNLYDLLKIAEKHWEPLSAALGRKASVMPLLHRFDNLRNSVAHSRQLLPFEQDRLSGIAGQIRNQVTIFMSAHDPTWDIYPRIESVTDQFGRRISRRRSREKWRGRRQTMRLFYAPETQSRSIASVWTPRGESYPGASIRRVVGFRSHPSVDRRRSRGSRGTSRMPTSMRTPLCRSICRPQTLGTTAMAPSIIAAGSDFACVHPPSSRCPVRIGSRAR